MDTEFISVTMSRREAVELYVALTQRAMLEDRTRQEKGLEPVAKHEWLERLSILLQVNAREQDGIEHVIDDELWEHAWYTFTDEWAWHRARQEVERESRRLPIKKDEQTFQRLIEQKYQRDFEKFVGELEMQENAPEAENEKKVAGSKR